MQIEADRLRAERNANAKAVGFAKSKGQDLGSLLGAGEALGAGLQGVEKRLEASVAKALQMANGLVLVGLQSPGGTYDETLFSASMALHRGFYALVKRVVISAPTRLVHRRSY